MTHSTHNVIIPRVQTSLGDGPFAGTCWAPNCPKPIADSSMGTKMCFEHIRQAYVTFLMLAETRPDVWPNDEPLKARDVTSTEAKGIVYFVRVGELIKIGWTEDLKRRMLQLGADHLMSSRVGTRLDERALHAKFHHLLVKGREWFRAAPELLDFIKDIQ